MTDLLPEDMTRLMAAAGYLPTAERPAKYGAFEGTAKSYDRLVAAGYLDVDLVPTAAGLKAAAGAHLSRTFEPQATALPAPQATALPAPRGTSAVVIDMLPELTDSEIRTLIAYRTPRTVALRPGSLIAKGLMAADGLTLTRRGALLARYYESRRTADTALAFNARAAEIQKGMAS